LELPRTNEEELLRSVAIQNAHSILLARQRAEQELVAAKEALELRSAELERANALIRTIAENAASSLLMLDERGVATYVNPAAVEQTGYTQEEFSTTPFHDLLHARAYRGGHAIAACAIRNAREQMVPLKNHHDVFVRKNGSLFPVSCSLAPLQREGLPAGAVLEFRDISDEEAARRALEEANRRKDEFLATLSHELRTPMTAVLGWARMLKAGLPPDDERAAIEAIEKSAEIQAQLIDDVLDVSRIVAGKMTFKPMPVNVGPALHAALATVHPAATAKEIEILASVPPQLPPVLGDEGRLQQIFWNLLSNAVKFTARGGAITVRVAVVGSLLRVTVQDSGKGIDLKYLPHVFEPFSQEDGSMTRSHEGIGLGLSIVRSLVELHGGRIHVDSKGAGHGATFTIELPFIESMPAVVERTPNASRRTVGPPSADLPTLRGNRVLVIDDQAFTRDVVAAMLRRADAEVRAVASAREGLQEIQAVSPDVVVCDLAMPEEDGFSFLRALRALPAPWQRTPVIALTAFGRPEDRQRALGGGVEG
jgi:PAS domain S-box-containing protein